MIYCAQRAHIQKIAIVLFCESPQKAPWAHEKGCARRMIAIVIVAHMYKPKTASCERATDACRLSALAPGQSGVVQSVTEESVLTTRLSGLGIFEGVRLRVVRATDPMIICLFGTRAGLAREVADHILVQPCPPCRESE